MDYFIVGISSNLSKVNQQVLQKLLVHDRLVTMWHKQYYRHQITIHASPVQNNNIYPMLLSTSQMLD